MSSRSSRAADALPPPRPHAVRVIPLGTCVTDTSHAGFGTDCVNVRVIQSFSAIQNPPRLLASAPAQGPPPVRAPAVTFLTLPLRLSVNPLTTSDNRRYVNLLILEARHANYLRLYDLRGTGHARQGDADVYLHRWEGTFALTVLLGPQSAMSTAEQGGTGFPVLLLGALDGLYALIGPLGGGSMGGGEKTRVVAICAALGIGLATVHPLVDGMAGDTGEVGGMLDVVATAERVKDELRACGVAFEDGGATFGVADELTVGTAD